VFGLQQIAEPVLAEVAQCGPRWKRPAGELLDCLGQEDLTTMTCSKEPREPVEGCSQVVAVLVRVRLPGMQPHAHPKCPDLPPVLGKQRPLSIKGRGDGGGCRREGGLDGIPDRLEVGAAMRVDGPSSRAMWRATTAVIAFWSRSQSAVLPSMSVKRKVTVPEGRSGTGPFLNAILG
jgi:hypothetical protein